MKLHYLNPYNLAVVVVVVGGAARPPLFCCAWAPPFPGEEGTGTGDAPLGDDGGGGADPGEKDLN